VLDVVGGMNDSLFIDYVDIEWCLRAKNLGYEILGCYRALMNHYL
jgi:rhamnosyltransferase